jgi:hypothetical protein
MPAFTLYGRWAGQAGHCIENSQNRSAVCRLCRIEPKPAKEAPAPGDYDLPPAWRTGPAVTIAGKVPEPVSTHADVLAFDSVCHCLHSAR